MRISDWSSDVCSSDLLAAGRGQARGGGGDRRLEEAGTRRKAGSPAVGRGYFPACGRGDSARPCVTAAATSAQQTNKKRGRTSHGASALSQGALNRVLGIYPRQQKERSEQGRVGKEGGR